MQLNESVIERINRLGESFAGGMRSLFAKLDINGQVTGIGSLQNIHFSDRPLKEYERWDACGNLRGAVGSTRSRIS